MWELRGLTDTITNQFMIGISDDGTFCDDNKPPFSNTDADIKRTAPLSDSS